jgi:hypothetical protein
MYVGKMLFAQLMDFLTWKTFHRIVARYDGDERVETLSCDEQCRAMIFAQLTCRESLRKIETCLSVQSSKLYHMGFREPVQRSTLADWQSVDATYKIASKTSRKFVERGRPPDFAGGSNGSMCLHSSSVASLAYRPPLRS